MRTLSKGLVTFFKNVIAHGKPIVHGHEHFLSGFRGVTRDLRKLLRSVLKRKEGEDEQRAKRYVKKGKHAYNQKRYEAAETAFREAILADDTCGIAYTFLGHTLYKMGRFREAIVYWGKAIDIAPGTEAARIAQQKISFMQQKRNEAKAWIEDRIVE